MSTARIILSNTFIQIGGKIFVALVSIITVKLITNFLSLEGYGQYVSIYEFLAFFGIVADFGLFTIAVREMAREPGKEAFILGNILSVRTLLAALMMLLAVGAAFLIPQYEGTYIPMGVAIASLSIFLSILQGTISSVLQVHLKMQYATYALLAGKAITIGYMVYVVVFAFSEPSAEAFYHLLWAGVAGGVVMLVMTWVFAQKFAPLQFRFDFDYWKSTLLKALPYGIALILNMVYFRIGSIMLLLMKGSAEVGLYGVPMKILDILSIIPVYFMNSVLPLLTRQLESGSERAKVTIQYAFEFLLAIGLPIMVGAYVLAYPLIFAVSSPEFLSRLDEGFYGSDIALQILTVALVFSFASTAFTFTLIALGHQGKLLYISVMGAAFNILFNLYAIPAWGFRGAAFTSVLNEVLILVLSYLLLRRHFDWTASLGGVGRIAGASLGMGLVIWALRDPLYALMQNFNLFFLIPIGGLVYGGLLVATGVINKERLALLRRNP